MLDSVIMQVAATIDITAYTDLIREIGLLAGVIGGVVAGIAGFVKAKSSNAKVDNVADEFIKAGQYLTAMGQKTVEQEERIKTIGEALVKLSPDEVKQWLASNRVTVEELREHAKVARQQLEILDSQIPREAKANLIRNLPREKA